MDDDSNKNDKSQNLNKNSTNTDDIDSNKTINKLEELAR